MNRTKLSWAYLIARTRPHIPHHMVECKDQCDCINCWLLALALVAGLYEAVGKVNFHRLNSPHGPNLNSTTGSTMLDLLHVELPDLTPKTTQGTQVGQTKNQNLHHWLHIISSRDECPELEQDPNPLIAESNLGLLQRVYGKDSFFVILKALTALFIEYNDKFNRESNT